MSSFTVLRNLFFALALLVSLNNANAGFINPAPSVFNNDSGTQLFGHSSQALSIQVSDPLSGVFGFYFAGNPGNKITIFDATDNTPGNAALVDFLLGKVSDVDANSPQSAFAPSMANIGFFLTLGANTIYSEAAHNLLGLDLVGTFSEITQPSAYLIAFELPNGNGGFAVVAAQVVGPLQNVPEPAGTWLIVIGLLAICVVLGRQTVCARSVRQAP